MKKTIVLLRLAVGLLLPLSTFAQNAATEQKMSVDERMAKARAAKMEKKTTTNGQSTGNRTQSDTRFRSATPDNYRASSVKPEKGPNGEAVRVGERGGKYYINKNGKRTYTSSNQ